MESKFAPGQWVEVYARHEVAAVGVVEEVIWGRDMSAAVYLVEWWDNGAVTGRRFSESDLRPV